MSRAVRLGVWAVLACTVNAGLGEAHAEEPRPYGLGVGLGPRRGLTHGDSLGRLAVTGSRRWFDRLHAGVRLELELGMDGLLVTGEVAEAGVWLHASRKIDVLLGWRVGHARFAFSYATIHAVAYTPVAELAFRISPCVEIRFAPANITAYHSGLWHVTLGPEVGVTWRR